MVEVKKSKILILAVVFFVAVLQDGCSSRNRPNERSHLQERPIVIKENACAIADSARILLQAIISTNQPPTAAMVERAERIKEERKQRVNAKGRGKKKEK